MRLFLAIILLSCNLSSGKTILVGPKQRVTSIRAAIRQASAGDTIIVGKGVYREGNIVINKKLTLLGDGFPTLDGQQRSEVVSIAADSVVFKGFRIVNSGHSQLDDPCGIRVYDRNYVSIENNILDNNYFGIFIQNGKH